MKTMDIQAIIELLPQRYPFLLVDRVLDVIPGESIRALKNVTINEPFFTGHFPGHPVMPGVLILEALAQTCGILAYETAQMQAGHSSILYYAGVDKARFKRIVKPGDQLYMEAKLVKVKQDIWKCKTSATVEGQLACSADILAAKRDLS